MSGLADKRLRVACLGRRAVADEVVACVVGSLMDAAWRRCCWQHGRSFVGHSFAGGDCGVIVGTRAAGLSAAFGRLSIEGGPEKFEGSGGSSEVAVGVVAAAGYRPAVVVGAKQLVDVVVPLPFVNLTQPDAVLR